jgi:hypothetical protein
LFFPILEWSDPRNLVVYLRTSADPAAMVGTARAVIHDIDPILPLHDVHTLEQKLDQSLANERLLALDEQAVEDSQGFPRLAAADGIEDLEDVGAPAAADQADVRALGGQSEGDRAADPRTRAGDHGAPPLAWVSTRLVRGQLYGVTPIDPTAIAAAVSVLLIVATIAGLIPALRAARMNPTAALRHD